jgi:hypothetical protein
MTNRGYLLLVWRATSQSPALCIWQHGISILTSLLPPTYFYLLNCSFVVGPCHSCCKENLENFKWVYSSTMMCHFGSRSGHKPCDGCETCKNSHSDISKKIFSSHS